MKHEMASACKGVKKLVQQWARIKSRDGILYRQIQIPGEGQVLFQLLLPQCLQSEVLKSLHDDHGHQGIERTKSLVRQKCFWPFMGNDIEQYCRECNCCTLAKAVQPTDVFSKFSQAYPTPDQHSSTVACVLTEKWFYIYGVPKRIHSNEGKSFEGELMKRLCHLYEVEKSRTTPYHPEGNGQCERFN